MSKPLVTVIIPVYNVELYLQQCIDSLLNQTLKGLELIFVNDCSIDNSLEILKKSQSKNKQIIIIDSKENLRQGGARNLGIHKASADYIGFVDSDDFVECHMYERLYNAIEKYKTDAVFIQYSSVENEKQYSINVSGGIPIISWSNDLHVLQDRYLGSQEKNQLLVEPIGGVYCGLYRKEIILQNNISFPEKLRFEDNYWGSLVYYYITSFHLIDEVGYYYRQNPSSTMHKRNQSYILDRRIIENNLIEDAKKRGIYEDNKDAWDYIYINRYVFSTYYLYVSRFDKPDMKFIDNIFNDLKTLAPYWKKNIYYKKNISILMKIINSISAFNPRVTTMLLLCACKIKRFVKG